MPGESRPDAARAGATAGITMTAGADDTGTPCDGKFVSGSGSLRLRLRVRGACAAGAGDSSLKANGSASSPVSMAATLLLSDDETDDAAPSAEAASGFTAASVGESAPS